MGKRGPTIPLWVRDAADEAIAVHGLGPVTTAKRLVAVPPGFLVSDGQGGEREALPGEKRPIGEFVSLRAISNWIASDRIKELRAKLANQHSVRLEVKARKLIHTTANKLVPLIEGKQPRLDEYGEHKIGPDGRPLYDQIKASEWVQVGQLALKIAEHAAGPPTQKVEMEHSGSMKITASTPEEIEEMRKAAIERIAARHAAQSSG